MLSFIHTADVHLDVPLVSLASLYEQRQADFRLTMQRIRDLVETKQVDFWLIAGDLLEYHGGKRSTAIFLQQLFASVDPIPVLIAPGNHDPWTADSFYQTMDWPANVIFFTPEWGIYEFPEKSCVLYGWGFPHAHVSESPLLSFPGKLAGYQHHVMIVHGTVQSGEEWGHHPYAPLPLGDLYGTGMDYVALGHIHKPQAFLHPVRKTPFAAYPGSPESLNSKEEGERCVLYGRIDATGEIKLESIAVQTRTIRKVEIEISTVETMEQLIDHVKQKTNTEERDNLLYITLTGQRPAHFNPVLDVLHAHFQDFFFCQFTDKSWPDVDEETLRKNESVLSRWLAELETAETAAGDDRAREIARLARKEALKQIGGSLR